MPTVLKRPQTVLKTFVKCARTLPTMLSALSDQIYDLRQRRGEWSQEGYIEIFFHVTSTSILLVSI